MVSAVELVHYYVFFWKRLTQTLYSYMQGIFEYVYLLVCVGATVLVCILQEMVGSRYPAWIDTLIVNMKSVWWHRNHRFKGQLYKIKTRKSYAWKLQTTTLLLYRWLVSTEWESIIV
jgi:hypothetical protein